MVHHNRYNNQSIGWKRKKEKEREIGFIYREGVFWTAKENFLLNKFGCYVDITTLVMVGLTVAEKYKFSLKNKAKKHRRFLWGPSSGTGTEKCCDVDDGRFFKLENYFSKFPFQV